MTTEFEGARTLSIKISGDWTVEDFAVLFRSLEDLYEIAATQLTDSFIGNYPETIPAGTEDSDSRVLYYRVDRASISGEEFIQVEPVTFGPGLDRLIQTRRPTLYLEQKINPLIVKSIRFNSPGGIDILGIGKFVEAIKGMFETSIKFFTERRARRATDENLNLTNEKLRISIEQEKQKLIDMKLTNIEKYLKLDGLENHKDYSKALNAANDIDNLIERGKIIAIK